MARAEFRIVGAVARLLFPCWRTAARCRSAGYAAGSSGAVYTLLVVVLGFTLFRADTLGQAGAMRGHVYREPD